MPSISFSDINTNLKPVPTWRFSVTLPTIDGGDSDLNGQKLTFLVERVTLPIQGVVFEPSPYEAGERKFPAARSLDILGITFIEDTSYNISKYLDAWRRMIVTGDGNFGLPKDYKKKISLESFDETGKSLKTFEYKYCAPTRIDSYEFDGTTSKPLMVNVYFEIDNINGGSGDVIAS